MPWSDKIEEKTKELFKAYDTDKSGMIGWPEFERALKAEAGFANKAEFDAIDTYVCCRDVDLQLPAHTVI